jgi:YesN/AraC family two-component response regulator
MRNKLPRILIVDDLAAVRRGIRSFLHQHSFRVCGEAGDGREAIEKVIEVQPDIVLSDISMPGMNGVNAALQIQRVSAATKIARFGLSTGCESGR